MSTFPDCAEHLDDALRGAAGLDVVDRVRHETAALVAQLDPRTDFGDDLLDVITDGEVVRRGATVEVVQVHGNRLVVKLAGE